MDGRRPRDRLPLFSVNVIPLVDIILVLLITFMIAASIDHQGVRVNLPKARSQSIANTSRPVTVTVDRNSHIYIQSEPVSLQDLVRKMKVLIGNRADRPVYLKVDTSVPYGYFVKVLTAVKVSGATNVELVTVPPEKGANG